jgi:tetratricopeptide (TPR) repeat protein
MAADLSYEAGDYEQAREDFTRLLKESMPGSDIYGLSLRRLHGLAVGDDPETAEALLTEYRDRYPEDQQAAVRLGVETARAWMDSGALARARSVLEVIQPADVEQAALRAGAYGRLEVLDGRPGAARGHLQLAAAVPAGRPPGRIEAIELLSLIDGSDSSSMAALGAGVVAATAVGDPGPLLESVDSWVGAGSEGGAGLAAFAAAELDAANLKQDARSVRIKLVRAWPRGPQAPRALLDLARSEQWEDPGQAAEWLEQLIVEYPESAMAPVARRALAELRDGVPGA